MYVVRMYYSDTGELLYHGEPCDLYISRYYARKIAREDQVVVKVCGGYKIMGAEQYRIWRKQK